MFSMTLIGNVNDLNNSEARAWLDKISWLMQPRGSSHSTNSSSGFALYGTRVFPLRDLHSQLHPSRVHAIIPLAKLSLTCIDDILISSEMYHTLSLTRRKLSSAITLKPENKIFSPKIESTQKKKYFVFLIYIFYEAKVPLLCRGRSAHEMDCTSTNTPYVTPVEILRSTGRNTLTTRLRLSCIGLKAIALPHPCGDRVRLATF